MDFGSPVDTPVCRSLGSFIRSCADLPLVVLGVVLILAAVPRLAGAQTYDILIDDGHVIDPRNGIDGPMDVAVREGTVARVAEEIAPDEAVQVIDASGYYVTPGLIDVHAHVFVGPRTGEFASGFSSVSPDDFSFRSGVTTVVDAGTSGWRNFPDFKAQVIDPSSTRVLAFLNIVGHGMWDNAHNHDISDMDPERTMEMIEKYPETIVGVKIGHFTGEERAPFDRALKAARLTDSPLLLECHLPEMPLEELLQRMRSGDIFTHAFGDVGDRQSILDEQGELRDFVREAREKGIVFDVGHGGGSFHYSQAVPAMEQGLTPQTFGTDLHRGSMNDGMKNMLNIMSKYLNMGMDLREIVEGATWRAAQTIEREDLGHLSEGAVADLTVLDVEEGNFGFVDAGGYKMEGSKKLEAELTMREGRVVWDLNGMAAERWNR